MSIINQMTIFVEPGSYQADVIRAVLAVKTIDARVVEVTNDGIRQQVSALTHYNELPLLVDREVTLTQLDMVVEYLDERFPAPSLLPTTPGARANARMTFRRLNTEMLASVAAIEAFGGRDEIEQIEDTFSALGNLFSRSKFLCSDTRSIADLAFTILLARAKRLGIDIAKNKNLENYFNAQAFELATLSSAPQTK